jgi:short-subunit dehydrogenase
LDYKNKVILIAGASSGIGKAVALALAPYQNTILITARRKSLLQQTANEIRKLGSKCELFVNDATNSKQTDKIVKQIYKKYGKVDIAILNIGKGPPSNTLTESVETISQSIKTNYLTMVHYFVPLIQEMKKQKSECMVAHVNSLATFFGIPMQGDYTAAKSAARLFLETARMELKHFGYSHIHVQTIHPGFVDSHDGAKDGIPSPGQISKEKAAEYILKGIAKNKKENLFPLPIAMMVRFGRIAPLWLKTRILLASAPRNY